MILPPPISTLFPYTTLFRSFCCHRTATNHCWNIHHYQSIKQHHHITAAATEQNFTTTFPPPQNHPNHPITDRKSTRLNSSHQIISYAVFCLKKKKNILITE